jgi:hypothetical protein
VSADPSSRPGRTDPGREPELERLDEEDPERARRLRRIGGLLQAGGIVFLAVTALGLIPSIVGASFPALGARLSVLVWIVAPAIPIALLVVAAVRLRR